MSFNEFKSKFKDTIDVALDFITKHKRNFIAVLVFIAMALVLFLGTDSKAANGKYTLGVYKSFKTHKGDELKKLIDTYYDAYAKGDTEKIKTIASPICDKEISYIQMYSAYIEDISGIKVYSKPGLTAGSYLVVAEYSIKYNGIDTLAPGLTFFYVETDKHDKLKINNTYCYFNEKTNVYEWDPEISDLYAAFICQQDLIEKRQSVQAKYDKAIKSDGVLNEFMEGTIKTAIEQWNKDYEEHVKAEVAAAEEAEAEARAREEAEAKAKAEAEAKAKAEEEAKVKAEEEAKAQAEQQASASKGKITSKANVREQANKDSNKLGSVEANTEIKILGEEGDFFKFDYNGTQAYVTKEAVAVGEAAAASTDSTEATQSTVTLEPNKKVNLATTVNIRKSMDTNSSKVATAYKKENVTVIQCYAEGWTKVKYGNKEGYVRTDLLQKTGD